VLKRSELFEAGLAVTGINSPDIVLGQSRRVHRPGEGGEWLCCRRGFTRHPGSGDRPFFRREQWSPRFPVEQENMPHLGRSDDAGGGAMLVKEYGLRRDVPVPDVAMYGLEVPQRRAVARVQGDNRGAVVIHVPTLNAAIVVGLRSA